MNAKDYDCIVLIGGNGTRMGSDGPKALLRVGSRRAIDWTLDEIREIRFNQIVIAGPSISINESIKHEASKRLISPVTTFCDEGKGVHGIPWQMRDMLSGSRFLMLAGHAMTSRSDVRQMIDCQRLLGVGLYEKAHNLRSRTVIPRDGWRLPSSCIRRRWFTKAQYMDGQFIARPYSCDRRYLRIAKASHFNVSEILEALEPGELELIELSGPVEAEVASEWARSVSVAHSRRLGRAAISSNMRRTIACQGSTRD